MLGHGQTICDGLVHPLEGPHRIQSEGSVYTKLEHLATWSFRLATTHPFLSQAACYLLIGLV
jgi:hypothetical protein